MKDDIKKLLFNILVIGLGFEIGFVLVIAMVEIARYLMY